MIEAVYDLNGVKNRKDEKAPSARVKEIMSRLDSNLDGKLSL